MTLESIYNFFNTPFFVIFWWISSIFIIIWVITTLVLVIRWVVPVLYRLWLWLSKRKIAIFAEEKFDELKNMLVDSNVFKENNVIKIWKSEIKKSNSISVLLVHWNSFKDNIDEIIAEKKYSDAIIIYAPQEEWFIDGENLKKLNLQSNCIIVNFKWRLLNDILVSMITTSYEKR